MTSHLILCYQTLNFNIWTLIYQQMWKLLKKNIFTWFFFILIQVHTYTVASQYYLFEYPFVTTKLPVSICFNHHHHQTRSHWMPVTMHTLPVLLRQCRQRLLHILALYCVSSFSSLPLFHPVQHADR